MLTGSKFEQFKRTLPKLLWLTVASLLTLQVIVIYIHYQITEMPCQWRELFYIQEDESLGFLFTILVIIFGGLLTFIHARRSREESHWTNFLWVTLGAGLCLFAVGRLMKLHLLIQHFTNVPWVIFVTPAAILAGIIYLPFLLRLPASTRHSFILAGALSLGGAIGGEFAAWWFPHSAFFDLCNDRIVTLGHSLTTAIEAGMETSGPVVFVNAMLRLVNLDLRRPNKAPR